MRLGEGYCGDVREQICVIVMQATTQQSVVIDSVVARNNWYGISSVLSPAQALARMQNEFWQAPNCGNGCRQATILSYTDGRLTNMSTVRP